MTMTIIRPPQPRVLCHLNEEEDALWKRLLAFNFDQEGPFPFSRRLAKESRFPYEYALHVIEEYRKSLFLAAISGQRILPADDVRRAWRLHLIYSVSYWKDLCENVLGKPIHHFCEDGSESRSRDHARFQNTQTLYRTYFGEPPEIVAQETETRGSPFFERLVEATRLDAKVKKIREALPAVPVDIPHEHRKFWHALEKFKFNEPFASFPFVLRLAEENEWSLDFAVLVVEEYRKFIYLLRTTGHWVTPSLAIDECWHLHLQNTTSYWQELCKLGNGRPIHHHPGNGSKGDTNRFKAIFQRTLFDYQQVFGSPPESVWGKTDPRVDWRSALAGTKF